MHSKKPLKTFLFPIINILLGLFLVVTFFIAGQNIVQTFSVASMTALNNLKPVPFSYLWDVNNNQAAINKNKIRTYADYYEHMLQVFPNLWDAYAVLGYCYHYLGDDSKAVDYLKIAISKNPVYLWNYYNLAIIYIKESRYDEAAVMLNRLIMINPKYSLIKMFSSQWVFLPLTDTEGSDAVKISMERLNTGFKDSFILLQLLKQGALSHHSDQIFKNLNMELHAF